MGLFFYFNRSRFMKGVWGILRGPSIVFRQTKETKYHKQWPSLRYYYRRIKQIIWSILREFILESLKKTPEFRKFNVLFNLLSMFSIQVLSRRAKKGK